MAQNKEIQEMSYALQVYKEQANMLLEHQRRILEELQGLTITQETIDGLEKLPENHEIILPIGNRAYLNARVQDPSKILIAIGKDIVLEKTLTDARAYAQHLIDALKKSLQQSKEQLNQVQKNIDEVSAALSQRTNVGTGGLPSENEDDSQ